MQSADHREEQDDREGESDPEEPTWEEFDDPLPEGSAYDQVYPGHIPSTLFQKSLLSVGTAFVAITAPWRGGEAATGLWPQSKTQTRYEQMQQSSRFDPVVCNKAGLV